MKADTILLAPRVAIPGRDTVDIRAIAMAGGVILAVGTESDILALRGPDTAVIEAPQGSTVLPGLKDSHLHFAMTGRARSVVNLSGVRNFDEWRARLDAYRREKNLRPGDWIAGTSWDQNRMEEKRFPTKRDFDEMFPENPVFCARCCNHVGVLNSAGLRALGLDAFTPDPPNGSFERTETGELTGFLIEGATAAAFRRVFTGDQKTLETWISDAADIALRAGLTEVHPDEFGAAKSPEELLLAYEALAAAGKLPLTVELELRARDLAETRDILRLRNERTLQAKNLRFSNLKILLDGSLGARTAAMDDGYSDAPGERGVLILDEEHLRLMVREAHAENFPVAIHVIGDRAARVATDAIAAAVDEMPHLRPRHRLVHLQVASEAVYREIARLGIVADIQPRFLATDWPIVEARFGPDRAKWSYIWRTLAALGIPTAGGSDSPIEPLDPLLGMHAALTRQDPDGNPGGGFYPDERLSGDGALSLFSSGVAYAAGAENVRGRIHPGYKADFTVVEGDYLADPARTAECNTVLLTIVDGAVVYEKK